MVQRFGRSVKGDVVGIGKQIRKIALPGLALCILGGFLDTVKNPQYDTAAEVVKYCRMGRLARCERKTCRQALSAAGSAKSFLPRGEQRGT